MRRVRPTDSARHRLPRTGKPDSRSISDVLTAACRTIDPKCTDEMLEEQLDEV